MIYNRKKKEENEDDLVALHERYYVARAVIAIAQVAILILWVVISFIVPESMALIMGSGLLAGYMLVASIFQGGLISELSTIIKDRPVTTERYVYSAFNVIFAVGFILAVAAVFSMAGREEPERNFVHALVPLVFMVFAGLFTAVNNKTAEKQFEKLASEPKIIQQHALARLFSNKEILDTYNKNVEYLSEYLETVKKVELLSEENINSFQFILNYSDKPELLTGLKAYVHDSGVLREGWEDEFNHILPDATNVIPTLGLMNKKYTRIVDLKNHTSIFEAAKEAFELGSDSFGVMKDGLVYFNVKTSKYTISQSEEGEFYLYSIEIEDEDKEVVEYSCYPLNGPAGYALFSVGENVDEFDLPPKEYVESRESIYKISGTPYDSDEMSYGEKYSEISSKRSEVTVSESLLGGEIFYLNLDKEIREWHKQSQKEGNVPIFINVGYNKRGKIVKLIINDANSFQDLETWSSKFFLLKAIG